MMRTFYETTDVSSDVNHSYIATVYTYLYHSLFRREVKKGCQIGTYREQGHLDASYKLLFAECFCKFEQSIIIFQN